TAAAAGPRVGALAGWLSLALPAMFFTSMRVEPTSLVALLIACAAALAVHAADRPSPLLAAGAGLVAGLASITKENGLVAAALLLPGLLAAAGGRRVALAAAFIAGVAVPTAANRAIERTFDTRADGDVSKLQLPLADVKALLEAGTIPHALTEGRSSPPPERLTQIRDPSAKSATRALAFLDIQARRLAAALGPWLVIVPIAMGWIARRRGAPRVLVALGLALVPCMLVVTQPRHADVAVLGGVACVAVVAAARARWAAGALVLALSHAAWRSATVEWDELARAVACADAEARVAEALRPELPPDQAWCSTAAWFPFRIGATSARCLLEDVRVGERRTFVVERDDLLSLRDRGTEMSLDLRCGAPRWEGCVAKTSVCTVTNAGLGPSGLSWTW
ncbi:MAG: hypothetical protein FJ090_18985, partial [Deltaproteobacteria bacterium]|nr:hypothetical protein [Deltaproteobacteria bacterium]